MTDDDQPYEGLEADEEYARQEEALVDAAYEGGSVFWDRYGYEYEY